MYYIKLLRSYSTCKPCDQGKLKKSPRLAQDGSLDGNQPSATVVLPYIRNVSECIRRILTPLNIRTCFRPHTTLIQLLVHPKTPLPMNERTGAIYRIPCSTCDEVYIGQTGRMLEHRLKEHKRALTSSDGVYYTSAVAEHAIKSNHHIDWNNAKVVDYQQNIYTPEMLPGVMVHKKERESNEQGNWDTS